MHHTVSAFLDTHHVRAVPLVVAVSGGLDSIALLHTLYELQAPFRFQIHVAHVNHGLRGVDSDDDERFVVAVADKLGITCHTASVRVAEEADRTGDGIESTARRLRYEWLATLAQELDAPFVAVAHTADDVAETMLMHLARGSGIDGLTAHHPTRALGSATLIRPMVSILRSQIVEAAHSHGWVWREDASNVNQQFRRNHLRQSVMPHLREVFGSDVAKRMARSAELMRSSRTIISEVLNHVSSRSVQRLDNAIVIDLQSATEHSAAVVRELLRSAIAEVSAKPASYVDTIRIEELLEAEPGSMATLQNGIVALRERDHIVVSRNKPPANDLEVVIGRDGAYVAGSESLVVRTSDRSQVVIDPDPSVLQLDAGSIRGTLVWRVWQNGDRMVPFGMHGSVLVSDVLTDRKVPHGVRRHVRVLADDVGLLWICGLRAAERTRIVSATHTVQTFTHRHSPTADNS